MKGSSLLASFLACGVAALGAGCKAKEKLVDRQETLDTLKKCQDNAEENKRLIASYEAEIRRLEQNGAGAGAGEIVVTIEGEIKPARPGAPGLPATIDPKLVAAQSQSFIDIVQKSRGAIQKCYEQALKKDTNLQGRTVTLNVSASFSAAGQFQRTSFSPVISEAFDGCMRSVAGKWQLPAAAQGMTFKAQVSLTPS
jgi:hypothetical protein